MRLVLTNISLTPEEFNLVCFFLKTAYSDCVRDGDTLTFPEVSSRDEDIKTYYDDMGDKATVIQYQRWRILEICKNILILRGDKSNPDKVFRLELKSRAKERYTELAEKWRAESQPEDLLYSGDFQCPDSGFGVVAVWDIGRSILWFEICETPPWDVPDTEIPEDTYRWCAAQGSVECESAKEANEILYKAIGQDALIGGFDESLE